MECPICFNPTHRIFQKYGYWICECKFCHHRCAEIITSNEYPSQIYGDEYFNEGQAAGYLDYLSEAKILTAHGSRYGTLLKLYTTPGTILDVGAAAGFILKGFQESGWVGIGLEPNLSMAIYGRTQLGLQIETGNLEQFSSTQQFDCVSMIQVIAHFYDIREALQKAVEVTRPGGFWIIETWDRESWIARVLGEHWHEYQPPSVLHWFSIAGLNRLVTQFGFSEVARGCPAKYLNGAHAKFLLEHNLQRYSLGWMRSMLKLVPDHLEIPYPPLDLFWILFQKTTSLE